MFERCLYFNINALSREVNKIWAEVFDQFDLSPAHAYLLRLVLENPGITQQAICGQLKLEKSTVTRFVVSLETRGYLFRQKSGRQQLVYATKFSQTIQKDLQTQGDKLYKQMLERLGKAPMSNLVKDLRETALKLE